MRTWLPFIVSLWLSLLSFPASAQDLHLSSGGSDLTWAGVAAGARAGLWLDQGPLSVGDNRRDLVIGAPGDGTSVGHVYVIFGRPGRTGVETPLSRADTVITGPSSGGAFGTATAVGNIFTVEGSSQRALVVGAPAANSNAGIVYVFRGGFGEGNVIGTDSPSLVLEIRGRPGDQLGRSLATADLNGDGYREIVIGAPGNNRIYIIYGGATAGGTVDLSVSGADVTISGAGLGDVLAAGNVTAHPGRTSQLYEVYDLLIGVPRLNLVYLIRGRDDGSRLPTQMLLSRDESAYFSADAGDRLGSAIRISDIDHDGVRDIILGAPGADGPGEGRPDSGEVYLIYGRTGLSSMNIREADVTFYGPAAGAGIGSHLTSGDINRDSPDDIGIVGGNGFGPEQEVILYYGRRRDRMGTLLPSGRRMVDFASEAASRRIHGDGSFGRIAAVQVFEETGEGARDVVIGTPDATVASRNAAGLVHVTLSPKLALSPASRDIEMPVGASRPLAMAVNNPSPIPIEWRAVPQAPWVSNAAGGLVSRSASGDLQATATALVPGVQASTIQVTSLSEHLTMTVRANVRITGVTVPSIRSTSGSSVAVGSAVTWTAQSEAGGIPLEYRWWRFSTGSGTWASVQDYSTSNSFAWTPSIAEEGTYHLQVWVRPVGSTASYVAYAGSEAFTVRALPVSVTRLSTDAEFPAAPGSSIPWSVDATGGTGSLEFQFWVYREGAGWSIAQGYSSQRTFNWIAAQAGRYALQVWVRSIGSPRAYDAWRGTDYFDIQPGPVRIRALTLSGSGSLAVGSPVTATAYANGGTVAPLQYQYWLYEQGSGWSMARAYSTDPQFTFTPTRTGRYALQVWVRSAGSTQTYEAYAGTGYLEAVYPTLTVNLSTPGSASPVAPGGTVTWQADVTGTTGGLEYQFWLYSGSAWSVARAWSATPTWSWTPAQQGTYAVQVWVRFVGSTEPYQAWAGSGWVSVTSTMPARVHSITSSPAVPVRVGTQVNWQATASGGTAGPLEFQFWIYREGAGWMMARDYSTASTFSWTPAQAGTYALQVWVRSAGSPARYEAYGGTGYFTVSP